MACYSPARLTIDEVVRRVPCGTCLGCRIDYSKMWALRCLHESKMHQDNCAVTLTIDDEHLKYGRYRPTLFKRDLQLFFKRLRKVFDVRYFACGEYGDISNRPHYHAILFGVNFKDKIYYSGQGDNTLYTSDLLNGIWKQGNCMVGEMSSKSAAYVARYCLKKLVVDSRFYYKDEGIEPEFLVMSRRPGIGRTYFDDFNGDFFVLDKCVTNSGDYSVPRYYDNLLKSLDIDLYEHIKAMRDERKRSSDIYERMPKRLVVKAAVKAAQMAAVSRPL